MGGRDDADARDGDSPPALERGVYVLTGPARSGKSGAALGLYRRHLDGLGRPRCLLIVPNAPAVAQVRSRLLAESPTGVVVAPAVTTFAGLAGGILAAAGKAPETLSAVRRHLLLARIVSELSASGGFRALAAVADTPGLVSALDAAIAELKRAAVEPERLASAVNPRSVKDADLVAVYRLYQEHLLATGRFDVEGQMWQARDVLAADPGAPLGCGEPAALAVDGFIDFTPTQLKMLALLAGRVETTLITLPLGDHSRRRRLWFWTRRTLERIREAIPAAEIVQAGEGDDPLGALFDLTAATDRPAPKTGQTPPAFTCLEAPDLEEEVRAAARAVKADLAAGAPPGSIAILARTLEPYAEPIERVFAAHGIPVSARPRRLDSANVVRYVLRLLALPPECEFHDLLAVIKSSYFRPSALGEGFDGATVATAEMAVRAANVLGGREAYGEALARLARRARMPRADREQEGIDLGPLTADAEAIERAGTMLEALLGRVDGLCRAGDLPSYVSAARDLVAALEVPAAAAAGDDDAVVAADLRALKAFDDLLDDLAGSGLSAGGAGAGALLVRAARVAASPPARTDAPVAVLDVLDARALRFDRVYLLGVNEKAFPQLRQDRCFIDESDRAAWASRGVALDRRSDLIGREMLLFYLAATRGESSLTLSYLSADPAGRARAPSVFVDELLRAADRQHLAVASRRVAPGQFVPPAGEIASAADAFNAAILGAFDDSPATRELLGGQVGVLLGWSGRQRGDLLRRAAFGIFAAHRRWRRGEPDAFDGRIDDPRLLKALTERIPEKWTFSASELNGYAQCPWQFFAAYLLRLRPLVAPEVQMTPADRGSFCHAVLWRTFTALRDRFGASVSPGELDPADIDAALQEAVDTERRRLSEAAVHSGLWEMQTEYWRGLLGGYLADQRRRLSAPEGAAYFELGFGLTGPAAERTDPASRADPVTLDADGLTLRLRGKIDRVDEVVGETGAALLAVDYKTGRVPAAAEISQGRDLQLALYARALAAMFDRPCAGGAYHDVRENKHRYFAEFRFKRGQRVTDLDYPQRLATAMAAVGTYVRRMRQGRFDALPAGDCPGWCPYRTACHYAEHRARRKRAAAQEAGDA